MSAATARRLARLEAIVVVRDEDRTRAKIAAYSAHFAAANSGAPEDRAAAVAAEERYLEAEHSHWDASERLRRAQRDERRAARRARIAYWQTV